MTDPHLARRQQRLNAWTRKLMPWTSLLTIDGQPGPHTRARISMVKWFAGLPDHRDANWTHGFDWIVDHPGKPHTRIIGVRGLARGRARRAADKKRHPQAPYVFPFGEGLTEGRIDQGIDPLGGGYHYAVGDAVVTRRDARGTPNGWPGGGYVVYHLLNGPRAGWFVYGAENIDVYVTPGQRIARGQRIAYQHNAFPYSEWGWAANGAGQTLAVAHGTQNTHPNHSYTPEGIDFTQWVKSLPGNRW